MASKKLKAKLKSLFESEPQFGQISTITQELYLENDRASAVLNASMLETSLEKLLKSKLRRDIDKNVEGRLFGFDGPIGTFSKKISISYAFSIIGPITFHDLEIIRILRNGFAHSRVPLNFQIPEIREACLNLRIPQQQGYYIPHRLLESLNIGHSETIPDDKLAKTIYIATCNNIAHRILATRGPNPPEDNTFSEEILP